MSSLLTWTQNKYTSHLLFRALGGVVLMFLCAQVSIPLQPVPMTLHTFAIALIALTHSPRETASSIGLYLALGLIGLPLFSQFSGGPGILFSPRGGYLIGFLLGGTVMSWCHHKHFIKNTYGNLLISVLSGQSVLYLCGISGLLLFMPLSSALQVGFLPFIVPGMAKSLLLTGALSYFKSK